MKKTFLIVLFATIFALLAPSVYAAGLDEGTVVVKVAIDSESGSRRDRGNLETKAKREALRKYLKTHDANLPEKLVEEALNEASKFVADIELNDDSLDFDSAVKQLSGEYTVELNKDDINKFLQINGASIQGNLRIILLEEPPSLGEIGMDNPLWNYYTKFQRRIRDFIVKEMSTYGLEIRLLADDDMYAEYKNLDGELVGVFYNSTNKAFEVNRELLDAVRANEPETIVLYYRIDTLAIDRNSGDIRVTMSLSFKNLDTNVSDSIGAQGFGMKTQAADPAMVIDDVALCAQRSVKALMSAEGAASKVNTLITAYRNKANQPAGPSKVVINAAVFDAKIRKKALYAIRKALIEAGVTTKEKVKTSNTTLNAELNPDVTDLEELYMETISPIFEELGAEIDDEKVFYGKGILQIKP